MMSEMKPKRRAPIVPGLLLILVGIWLLGRELNLPLFLGNVLWPWLLILAGLLIWVHYIFFPPRKSDSCFWGTAAILTGGFLLAWRNGYVLGNLEGWSTMWPIIPLIMGLSSLVQWVFSIREWGSMIFGVATTGVGVVGLAYTTGAISSATALALTQYWPLLIILVGVGFLIQALLGPKQR